MKLMEEIVSIMIFLQNSSLVSCLNMGRFSMEDKVKLYEDIAKRTDGDIYVGVVGPVRTGKSTFIKKFMDLLVIPNIDNSYKQERAKDELPQSAAGKTIMTTEPKFVPNEAVEIKIDGDISLKTRLVDCVGYLVNNAIGYLEDDMPRMVKTPWSEEEIPFEKAAEIGTKKVIQEHSASWCRGTNSCKNGSHQ